jgi:tRNA(Ile)-lysidine synthase
VSFGADTLLARLAALESVAGRPRRFVIALSGGLDSTALTHALASAAGRHGVPMLAVHVDHGLHPDSPVWAGHCRRFAAELGVEFRMLGVVVDLQSGRGPEAAARTARYSALRGLLEPGDWLLSGHHEDDQAETVLLNLMRGSGPAGLAGIRDCRPFAVGWLVRPLLDVPRSDLARYVRAHGLDYVADPSNLDQELDRNYLRHEVMPRLAARWPDAARRIRRSAALAREAEQLHAQFAAVDRRGLGERADRLRLDGLRALSPERQRNVLRNTIFELGLPMPGARHLDRILTDLVGAREDAQPLVTWPGARARRYRDCLYLLADGELDAARPRSRPITEGHVPVPGGLGVLVFDRHAATGLCEAVMNAGLELRFRQGGEEIKPSDHKHTKKLKKLLQDAGIVPWMRDRLPLVYADGRLVAVADLWLAADAVSSPGTAIRWENRPALH